MYQKSEIIFFVFGLERKSKGLYLVRILKTYPGIYKVMLDFDNRLLKVKYNPELINLNTIRKLAYFKECIFLSDQREIEFQITLLRKRKVWKSLTKRSILIGVTLFCYLLIKGVIMEKDMHWSIYLFLLIIALLILLCNYFEKKIVQQMNSKKKVYYRIYNRR